MLKLVATTRYGARRRPRCAAPRGHRGSRRSRCFRASTPFPTPCPPSRPLARSRPRTFAQSLRALPRGAVQRPADGLPRRQRAAGAAHARVPRRGQHDSHPGDGRPAIARDRVLDSGVPLGSPPACCSRTHRSGPSRPMAGASAFDSDTFILRFVEDLRVSRRARGDPRDVGGPGGGPDAAPGDEPGQTDLRAGAHCQDRDRTRPRMAASSWR